MKNNIQFRVYAFIAAVATLFVLVPSPHTQAIALPNGTYVYVQNGQLWYKSLSATAATQITPNGSVTYDNPMLTYNGAMVAAEQITPAGRRIVTIAPNGLSSQISQLPLQYRASSSAQPISIGAHNQLRPKWAPSAQRLVFYTQGSGRQAYEYVLGESYSTAIGGDGSYDPVYSPNAKYIAMFRESSSTEVIRYTRDKLTSTVIYTTLAQASGISWSVNSSKMMINEDGLRFIELALLQEVETANIGRYDAPYLKLPTGSVLGQSRWLVDNEGFVFGYKTGGLNKTAEYRYWEGLSSGLEDANHRNPLTTTISGDFIAEKVDSSGNITGFTLRSGSESLAIISGSGFGAADWRTGGFVLIPDPIITAVLGANTGSGSASITSVSNGSSGATNLPITTVLAATSLPNTGYQSNSTRYIGSILLFLTVLMGVSILSRRVHLGNNCEDKA